MENPEVARVFDEVAGLLELQDANPFRFRAYRNLARTRSNLASASSSPPVRMSFLGVVFSTKILVLSAERAGFEPAVELPPHSISSAAPSAARSPLRSTTSSIRSSYVRSFC